MKDTQSISTKELAEGLDIIASVQPDDLMGAAARMSAERLREQQAELDVLQHKESCASCGQLKSLPYRRDDMGGYVCLTCVEAKLNESLSERDAARAMLDRVCLEGFNLADTIGGEPSDEYILRQLAALRRDKERLTEVLGGLYRSTAAMRFGMLAVQPARKESPEFKANANDMLAAEKLLAAMAKEGAAA